MSDLDPTPIGNSCGPYMYVMGDRLRPDGFRILLYGAYNAMGLIGTEHNGIAVLDNNRMQVWADRIGRQPSGWTGNNPDSVPKSLQVMFETMTWLPTEAFITAVNACGYARYAVETH